MLQSQWVKILSKGLITIPNDFRKALDLKVGEVARIKKVGRRLVLEPRDVADYELYSDKEFKRMIKEDKLPVKLAQKAASFWSNMQ